MMSTPDADDAHREDAPPSDEELQEPSTEKEPGEEPTAAEPDDPEPSHEAVGIGVVETPSPESGE